MKIKKFTVVLLSLSLLIGCKPPQNLSPTPISSPEPEPLFTPSLVAINDYENSASLYIKWSDLRFNLKEIMEFCARNSTEDSMDCANASALFGANKIESATINAAEPPPDLFSSTRVTESCQAAVKNNLKSPSTASFVGKQVINKGTNQEAFNNQHRTFLNTTILAVESNVITNKMAVEELKDVESVYLPLELKEAYHKLILALIKTNREKWGSSSKTLKLNPVKIKGLYTLSGQVDAQNTLGAMLRQDYSCYFAYTKQGLNFLGASIP